MTAISRASLSFERRRILPWLAALPIILLSFVGAGAQKAYQFPATMAVGSPATEVVTVPIGTAGTVASVEVLTGGLASLDFTAVADGSCAAGNTYTPGKTCTMSVQFQPKAPGERRGAVVLVSTTGAVMSSLPLEGMATGPLTVFVPATINTVAGNGQWIYKSGDDGISAITSPLFLPGGVAVDAAGNVFIADTSNNRIRRVDAITGTITSIAGDGTPGYANDGRSAAIAEVSSPGNLLLDGAGNLYIADSGNHAIRKLVLATGVMTTVAGQLGVQGSTGDGGLATAALLNSPQGLAMDAAGNLYIADTGNNVIREVDAATHIISTYAGTMGSAGFSGDGALATSALLNTPWGLATDATGNLYIADLSNSRIREVTPAGTITTIAGTASTSTSSAGLPATSTSLKNPAAVAVDTAGNVYIGDSGHDLVLKISATTGVVSFAAGNGSQTFGGDAGPATKAGLYGPYALALDSSGNLYIADIFHNRIREVFGAQATLSYSAVHVGSASPTQSQELENDGNAALQWTALTPDGNSVVDGSSTTCSTSASLVPDQTCNLGAIFQPAVTGNPVKATIQLASNSVNSPGVLSLSGQSTALSSTSTSLSASLNPSTLSGPVTFTAVVTGSKPTGTMQFSDGTTVLGSSTLDSSGIATFSTSTLALGSHTITAVYGGDSANLTSTSSPLIQVVMQAATVTLASSVNPVDVGASTTFTATVVAGGTPGTGSVAFSDGSTVLGTVSLNASGVATLPISTLGAGAHTIVAAYSGNTTTSAANSAPLTETVNEWATTVSVTSSITPALLGTGVTFTITASSGSASKPSGTVTLLDGSTPLTTLTLNASGVATYTTSTLTVGTHSVTAVYGGDVTNASGTSKALTEVVQKISTTTTVASSSNPSHGGGAVQLTTTVTATTTNSFAGTLGGAVTFTEGAEILGTGTLNSSGIATASIASLPVGSHTIVANYLGNDGYATSSSSAMIQVVQLATTSVAVSSSSSPSTVSNNVQFTAVVSGNGGIPAGTVTFLDGTTVLGRGTLNSAGQATFSTTALAVGSHSITASYGGDAADAASVSTVLTQVVQASKTAITLISSSNPASAGTTVTFAATISSTGGIPTGQLQLMEGSTLLSTGAISSTGSVQFTVSTLSPGSHTLIASFAGDANNGPATSSTLVEVIQVASSSVSLSSSANPTAVGVAVVFTAKATSTGTQPTGTVSFLDGATVLGRGTLSASGQATFSTSTLAAGSHSITASYGGDASNAPSVSAILTQVMQTPKTAITLVSGSNPGVAGSPITFAATISSTGEIPTGQLQLLEGSTLLGTATISSSGSVQFTLSTLSPGSHTLTVSFAGDANNGAATSWPLIEVIQLASSSLALTSNANPSAVGSPVVFTAKVSGTGNQPTGTVTFLDGATTLGTATLSGGMAPFSSSALTLGTHNITVTYAGDSTHSAASAAGLSQLVQQTTTTTLTSNANPSAIGGAVVLKAAVAGASGTPTGTVTFYDGSTVLGPGTLAGGVATLSTSGLSAGPHLLVARYSGDTDSLSSESASLTQIVNAATTTVSVASSANPASTGTAVVFTATVTSTGDQPTGSVIFMDGSATLGTTAVSNGAARLSVSTLGAGQHAIVARYSGDSVAQGSTSGVLLQIVQQRTSTTLVSSANPILTAQGTTLTATVTGTNATGLVTFSDGSTVLGQAAVSGGTATLTVPSLSGGTHTLTASYAGDSYDLSSASSPVTETVGLRPSSTTVTTSSATYQAGNQVTLVAVVQTTGPVAPTGTVTFTAGGTTLGTVAVTSAGAATLTFAPTANTYNITASYSGDAVYLPSAAAAYTITEGASTTFNMVSTPSSVSMASGDHTTLNVAISSTGQFADTLSLACLDLPVNATCTFSSNQVKLAAGGTVTATLVLDTGTPLGAGPSAKVESTRKKDLFEAAIGLPAALVLLFSCWLQRGRRRLGALLAVTLLLTGMGLSGCGSSFTASKTPAGSYNIRILATGNTTALTQTTTVPLTVK